MVLAPYMILADLDPLDEVLPHTIFQIGRFGFTNHMLMATVAAGLMLWIFPKLFQAADSTPPTGAKNFFESILEFLRLEVFRPALKEHTDRFVPFLWTMFFFILFCNLLGAIPFAAFFELISHGHIKHIGGAATGSVNTTGALAIAAFIFIHANGLYTIAKSLIDGTYGHHGHHEEHSSNGRPGHEAAMDLEHPRGEALPADVPGDFRAMGDPVGHYADDEHPRGKHGAHVDAHLLHGPGMNPVAAWLLALPLYLWNFAPHPFKPAPGASWVGWLADIPMFVALLILELVGAVIKPLALCVRLFANMVSGHILLAVLIGLIVVMPTILGQLAVGVPVLFLDVMIQLLEIFVAFLQAYIFTFLTTLFIASAVAPEH
ncbi:MAG: F0F1 ATP synthase subunit A [Planctomycetota bacterium]|nr:F0F1 ATP synthase subunit A [Planctomycetota bacterium]